MSQSRKSELAEELKEIQRQINELREQADGLLRELGGVTEQRARAYWFAQLAMLTGDDHGYLGNAGHSMQNTIDEIDTDGEEE